MKWLIGIGFLVALVAGALTTVMASEAAATHNLCSPHTQGDDLRFWPLNPNGAICRNFVVDPGHGQLVSRSDLLASEGLYTGSKARFTRNFLWYSESKHVTVSNPNVKWASCEGEPGYNQKCALGDIVADNFGVSHPPGRGYVLRAYDYPASVTFSAFEFGGMWIARSCGNWKDVEDRPNPVPSFRGVKFRDDNRNGVKDLGEQSLSGWQIRIRRLSSQVGQPTGVVGTVMTNASGRYRFNLNGHGPGRYRIEEIVKPGWKNYTPQSYVIDVNFGVRDRTYERDFGNAETMADVAKTSIAVIDAPANFDVNAPADVAVEVTVENQGPAEIVAVLDELTAVLPDDCVTTEPKRNFTALLRRGEPETRQFTYNISCSRPSEHRFAFEDQLSITSQDITDVDPDNNSKSTSLIAPVHAYTDLAAEAALSCGDRTDVGAAIDCVVDVTVTNDGFDLVDATAVIELSQPDDCAADPAAAELSFPGLADGGTHTETRSFSVTCSHRSFHDITASATVTANDPHVFDVDASNDTVNVGPEIVEVFHDATMEVTDVHLMCDEALGDTTFTCTADVEYAKTGPAPLVDVALLAELADVDGCSIAPTSDLEQHFTLDGQPDSRQFSWELTCTAGDVLHPASVTVDIAPTEDEPHAVDDPGPADDEWVVPYCLPTENPHGKKQPQAPGSGMNEDGFYIFGTLYDDLDQPVSVRDEGSGVVFGPFTNGTRVKWVEANGAKPSIAPMGGNNGQGDNNAEAVDYRVRARGDAQAFYVDEKGVEVAVTCLVPPFPK